MSRQRLLTSLRGLLRGENPARRPGGPVLLIRLDNLADLTATAGPAAAAQVMEQMAARIEATIGPKPSVPADGDGDLVLRLPKLTDRHALDQALRVQAACAKGYDLPNGRVIPVVTVVVVQPGPVEPDLVQPGPVQPDSPHCSETALAIHARRFLDSGKATQGGRVTLIDTHSLRHGAAPSQTPSAQASAAPPRTGAAAKVRLASDPDNDGSDQHGFEPSWVEPLFQPQVSCDTGAVSGFRTIPRVWHPLRGTLSPGEFARCASAADQRAATLVLLRAALAALGSWDKIAMVQPVVSLPVSAVDLANPDFADLVLWELHRLDQDPHRVLLELGEIATAAPNAHAVLQRLGRAGCRIDLCDFGTGKASPDVLRTLSPARVLIGRKLTDGCDCNPSAQQMVLSVLSRAGHLQLPTAAISVQTPAEHNFLAQIGCSHVSGPAVADPMTLSESVAFLTRHLAVQATLPRLEKRRDPYRDTSA